MEQPVKYFFWISAFIIIIIPACNKKAEEIEKEPVTPEKIPFTPPQDSCVTREQMRKWFCCNLRLDSLSETYLDSFRTDHPEKRFCYQENFTNFQDHICIQEGLHGGYEEYVWILKNSGNKKNKLLFDSLTAGTH